MSALLAVVGPLADTIESATCEARLASMGRRGSDRTAVQRSAGAVLGVARDDWEMSTRFAGPTLVASREGCHLVCDATLYYTSDLEDRLRGAGLVAGSDAAADLILAAYLAFGADCVDHLEGDFAFCLWDERRDTLFCARDPFGTRSLYHAELEGGLAVASTAHPLVEQKGTPPRFNPEGVLRSLLMRPGDGTVTALEGVSELPAGHTLTASGGEVRVRRYWRATGTSEWAALDSAEAVRVAADLLNAAVRERHIEGETALAMSGGQDSTAVLASLEPMAGQRSVDILSFQLPPDDPGNEDWYINLTADSFGLPVHWVGTSDLSLFDNVRKRESLRSHCHGHLFEGYNRAVAASARDLGDRVLLNGHGGDNLFGVRDWPMADLLRTGRWLQLRRYFRARGYRGMRQAVAYCLRPALPLWVFDMLERLRGRYICSRPWERPVPAWVKPESGLLRRVISDDRRAYQESIVSRERTVTGRHRAWGVMDSTFQRACAALYDLNRDEGMELRMPFYDRRLVTFVMSRPAEEFNQPGKYKVLLRRAVADRLPSRERAAQAGGLKPGTAIGVIEARWEPESRGFVRSLSADPWISAELGVVDQGALSGMFADGLGSNPGSSVVDLSVMLFVEAWLRIWREGATDRAELPL